DEKCINYIECGLSKSYSTSSNTLGIDLWRGRRCCSCNLQLPPLSQRQSERAKTPDRDIVSRPTTLPLLTPPSIEVWGWKLGMPIINECFLIYVTHGNSCWELGIKLRGYLYFTRTRFEIERLCSSSLIRWGNNV
uniref:cAMP-specific 3',5'-cyclic phosphodiesterase 4B n=1 Tax=Pelusios castaneus TaxID=367368 RepID=A0A8C8R825_9SAUR